jgi:large subunit ribosomal protein L23
VERTAYDILKRPLITEKATLIKETSNVVVFEVDRKATKTEIQQAVEAVFSVTVEGVRTAIVRGKTARRGRHVGRKSNWKKAFVTLKEGDHIEFFEGV